VSGILHRSVRALPSVDWVSAAECLDLTPGCCTLLLHRSEKRPCPPDWVHGL
jgi:hypothetical protein